MSVPLNPESAQRIGKLSDDIASKIDNLITAEGLAARGCNPGEVMSAQISAPVLVAARRFVRMGIPDEHALDAFRRALVEIRKIEG